MRPETRAANVSMSHVSPGLNVSLSQCLARSLVSGLWSPPPLAPANGTPPARPRFARSRSAVRAPCAHQRQGKASHKAKRFQRRAGHGRGSRKVCENRATLSRTNGSQTLRTRQSAPQRRAGHGRGSRKALRCVPPFHPSHPSHHLKLFSKIFQNPIVWRSEIC